MHSVINLIYIMGHVYSLEDSSIWDVILCHLVVINILDILYGLEMSALPVSMV
jgi:hypothetical protein